jgi:hypothetical protein
MTERFPKGLSDAIRQIRVGKVCVYLYDMGMILSTHEALQTLKDAEFHALCDEILPRMSAVKFAIKLAA